MKMLPEKCNNEKKIEVSCQAWIEKIEWNKKDELASNDLYDGVKKIEYFDNVDYNMNDCFWNRDSKPISGKRNVAVPLIERKALDSSNKFKKLQNHKLPVDAKDIPLPNILEINSSKYIYEKMLQKKEVENVDKFQPLTYNSAINGSKKTEGNNALSDVTQDKVYDIENSYPIDFFSILPTVFKDTILCQTNDLEEDNEETECNRTECDNVLKSRIQLRKSLSCKNIPELKPNNRKISYKILSSNNSDHAVPSSGVSNIGMSEISVVGKTSLICKQPEGCPFKSLIPSERICRWTNCVDLVPSKSKLMEHLQTKHVYPQTPTGTFICLWSGCKVFGRPSCSISFLERHVLSHAGNKLYKCIVDNCRQRFSSQSMLQRHVNQHFKTPKVTNDGSDDIQPKLIRKSRQKMKCRRQIYSVQNRIDAFDADIMSQIQYSLVQMVQKSRAVSLNIIDSEQFLHITFQPKVIGSRQEDDGKTKYLIRWYPYNILEDEWLSKSEINTSKILPIHELPISVQQMFWNSICPKQFSASVGRPFKYKPESFNS